MVLCASILLYPSLTDEATIDTLVTECFNEKGV